ncbi:cell division protein FtsH, partial [bacterium]
MNQLYKNIAMWLIIIATVVLMFNLISYNKQPVAEKLSFSDFIQDVDTGKITEVTIQGSDIFGKFKDGKQFRTFSPSYPDLIAKL